MNLINNLINKIPASDENARPQYVGEKHAILLLPNKRFGIANYMGPGTHLIQRLKDHDPPRTYSDQVAKIHDCNYALSTFEPTKSKQLDDIRQADALMLNQLKDKSKDNKFNIAIGEKLIKSKISLEDVGILDRGKFAGKLNMYSDKDKKLFIDAKKNLF